MVLRMILAAVVVIGGGLCGKALSDAARLRARTLRALMEDVRLIRVHMVSMFEPVPDSLARASADLLRQVAEGMRGGHSAAGAWKAIRPAAGVRYALDREDREALDALFDQLGESGRESQDALLTGAAEKLERLADAAEERARAAGRLYGTLGLLAGLLLAVIAI